MCIKDIMLRELRDFGDAKGNLTVHRIPYEMTSAPVSGDKNSRIVVNPVFKVFKHKTVALHVVISNEAI